MKITGSPIIGTTRRAARSIVALFSVVIATRFLPKPCRAGFQADGRCVTAARAIPPRLDDSFNLRGVVKALVFTFLKFFETRIS